MVTVSLNRELLVYVAPLNMPPTSFKIPWLRLTLRWLKSQLQRIGENVHALGLSFPGSFLPLYSGPHYYLLLNLVPSERPDHFNCV